jgi:hypothetical protein
MQTVLISLTATTRIVAVFPEEVDLSLLKVDIFTDFVLSPLCYASGRPSGQKRIAYLHFSIK